MMPVVFVEPEDSANIGLVARVMKNFGFGELILVNPQCDLEKALYVSMHARDVVASARTMTFAQVRKKFDLLVATTALTGTDSIRRKYITPEQLKPTKSTALLIGRESHGLSNKEIEASDIVLHIPASHGYPTLNVSHALGIILYELTKNTNAKPAEPAKQKSVKVLFTQWKKIITKSYKSAEAKRRLQILERMMKRAVPTQREVDSLIGILRGVK